jgi:large subunit ribosomal protein L13
LRLRRAFDKIRAPKIRACYVRTVSTRPQDVEHDWYVVDAENRTLGRLATEVARRLRGKHRVSYTPHVDTGDYIVVINAEKVLVTGKKRTDKVYYRHSGYPGGIKATPFDVMIDTHPERVIEKAVKGMLPRNPLGRTVFRKLKVYAGPDHPHSAQQPKQLRL